MDLIIEMYTFYGLCLNLVVKCKTCKNLMKCKQNTLTAVFGENSGFSLISEN